MPIDRYRNLSYWAAKVSVVGLALPSRWIYVCQVIFHKDGSIFLQWPYFRDSDGIASLVRLAADGTTRRTVEFLEEGKVTSHLVKYAHHANGRVHFSQDGKVRTEIRRDAKFPLDGPIGRIMQIDANYPAEGFKGLTTLRKGRPHLLFNYPSKPPEAVRLTFHWRRKKDVASWSRPSGAPLGPKAELVHAVSGLKCAAFFLGPPAGLPLQNHLLVITCDSFPAFTGTGKPMLILRGGADSDEVKVPGDEPEPTEFLAAMYPVEDRAELEAVVGTIDFNPAPTELDERRVV